jgi:hypothetical protein
LSVAFYPFSRLLTTAGIRGQNSTRLLIVYKETVKVNFPANLELFRAIMRFIERTHHYVQTSDRKMKTAPFMGYDKNGQDRLYVIQR